MFAFEASVTWIILLMAIGIIMAVAEILIPSHGLLTMMSSAAFVAAIVIGFMIGPPEGVLTMLAVVILTPFLIYIGIRVWPHTPIAKMIILSGPTNIGKASDLAHLVPEQLVGRIGTAKTLLRPAGKMVLDNRQLDCMTEGDLVEAGTPVKIIAVRGAQVVVRRVAEEEA